MISIASNIQALKALNSLNQVTKDINHTSNVISTGKRINSAKDDPAGMQIANRMTSHIKGYSVVKQNISQGQSILDVTSSGLDNGIEILQKMKDLALESKNGTLSTDNRAALQESFNILQEQYNETIEGSSIFDKNLLTSGASSIRIQSGVDAGQYNTLSAVDASSTTLGTDSATINISDIANSDLSITAIDEALEKMGRNQATVGSQYRSLETRSNVVSTMEENLTESRSRIEDADMAKEVSKLQLLQAQQQMSMQVLSISMSLPEQALQLLR
jgi:flagellin